MIVFGWGRQTGGAKGSVLIMECSRCGNRSYFDLTQRKTWFTLFFIPIIPYESKSFLGCRICGYGWDLNDSQLKWAKRLNALTSAWEADKINDDDYLKGLTDPANSIGELWENITRDSVSTVYVLPPHVDEDQSDVEPLPASSEAETATDSETISGIAEMVHCPTCGKPLPADWRFCRSCGAEQPL
jgi:hypothetical protein